jgi:hypothetical protein
MNPFHALSKTYHRRIEPISSSLLAQFQADSGHMMDLSIGVSISLRQYWITPATERS